MKEELRELLKNHKPPRGFVNRVIKAWKRKKEVERLVKATTCFAGVFILLGTAATLLVMLQDRRSDGAEFS